MVELKETSDPNKILRFRSRRRRWNPPTKPKTRKMKIFRGGSQCPRLEDKFRGY